MVDIVLIDSQAHPYQQQLHLLVLFCLYIYYTFSHGEGLPLLAGEKREIEELLPSTTNEEDKEKIFSILGQAMCRPTGIQVWIY